MLQHMWSPSMLRLNNTPLYIYTTFCLSMPLSMGHVSCFQLLVNMNHVSVNLGVHVSLQVPAFNSLGYISRNEIAGSHGHPMFNFLSDCIMFSMRLHFLIPTNSAQ